MSSEPLPDETGDYGLGEGTALYGRAKDYGEWDALMVWLANHPELAVEFASHVKVVIGIEECIPPTPSPVRTGEMIGEFEILEEIGRGMDVVYRAFDTKLKRDVALKMVRGGREVSARELARSRLEAEIVASLDHENIVRIHARGEHDGSPYLVMPLMQGDSLADRLKDLNQNRQRPEKESAGIVRAIALGVQHAHEAGLIHRDLKPGNILLDKNGRPHVADFGLACRVDVASESMAGTVAYMAPEQAGDEKQLTTAVDIHALGVILFELLTGGTPFGGPDRETILRRIVEEPARPIRDYRPDVSRDLEAVCAKCLEKRPADRYQTAQEVADDLGRFLRGERVLARPTSLLDDIFDAGSRTEEQPYMVWVGVFFAAVHHTTVHCAIAGLALAGAPVGWMCGVMAYHLLTWFAQMWWFGIRRRQEMNKAERQGLAIHLALWVTMVSLVPLHLAYFGPNVLSLYPALTSLTALGLFTTSAIISGRAYPAAFAFIAQNVLFLFLPMWSWSILHGFSGGVLFALIGLHIWRVDRAAQKSRATPSLSD